MKSSNKNSIITGAVLLLVAALFSICLILQPLDFGAGGPGHNNIFFALGHVLVSVYGVSSILIPVFLLIAGLSCFATIWTAAKTMRLLTALLPFFTAVLTEKICRAVLGQGTAGTVKTVIAAVTGAMLVAIEIIGAGVIADTVNEKIFYGNGKRPRPVQEPVQEKEEAPVEEEKTDDDKVEFTPIKKSSAFDKALSKLSIKTPEKDTSYDELVESANEIYNEEVPSIEDYENIDKPAEPAPVAEEPVVEDEEEKNPASIITQEEFAALITPPEEDEVITTENPVEETSVEDELEWPNLPPKPETLPPEYDDSIDLDDPALEFPPKEIEVEETVEDEIIEETSPVVNVPVTTEPEETFVEEPAEEEPVSAAVETAPNYESPYAAASYVSKYTRPASSPDYPSGITLHDDAPVQEEAEEEKPVEKGPQYPAGIHIWDEEAVEETPAEVPVVEQPVIEEASSDTDDFENALDEFNNLFEETTPAATEQVDDSEFNIEEETVSDFTVEETAEADDMGFDPDYFEVEETAEEEVDDDKTEEEKFGFGRSVFSDMDADIRARMNIPEPSDEEEDIDVDVVEESEPMVYETTTIDEEELEPEEDILPPPSIAEENAFEAEEVAVKNPNAGANNLTADELTDFFSAQQKENTPVTKVIPANPPKLGNRAAKKGPYVIPSDLLVAYKDDQYWIIDEETKQASLNLKQTLAEFGIEAEIIGIKKGPVVTMFEILPAPGVKLQKIVSLQDNIALSLAAQSVRIVAPIPGKQAVGIEVPNRNRSVVGFREIIEMDLPEWNKMAVPVILGKDILGKAQLIDLTKTPHMLIAGATGSGKSVCVNSLILSILYKRSYKDVKLILVDPKVVELKLYNNIPHLLTPVITEPKKALAALQYCLCEMERRYSLLDGLGVRDIASYNQRIKERNICTEKLPYIVVIIDEFADLMATSGKELETTVARLTAMSRAVGIHLVLATQRPSVNVITGLIKANIPSRIAFMVASRTDSNIIIDSVGAEKLLGRGDMLYASAVDPAPVRIQGTFVTDQEVEDVVNAVKEYGDPDYIDDDVMFGSDDEDDDGNVDLFGNDMDEDPLYDQALEIVVQAGKASASYIQRRLKIGYNRAARLVEEMEERGIVGPANGSKPREIIHVP